MAETVEQKVAGAPFARAEEAALLAVLSTIRADLANIAAQFNQLVTDYNANTNIVTDTTAVAIVLKTK